MLWNRNRIRNFWQDPDPEKSFRNQIRAEIRIYYEVKLFWKTFKIWQFLNKNAQLKNINAFVVKNMSKKIMPVSRHNMQPNTLTRKEYKGKLYVKNIRKVMQDPTEK